MKKGFTHQTMCPVSGKPIDPSHSVEYKGKKVYFCCPNCPAAFEKDPEKFVAKLPQFAKAKDKQEKGRNELISFSFTLVHAKEAASAGPFLLRDAMVSSVHSKLCGTPLCQFCQYWHELWFLTATQQLRLNVVTSSMNSYLRPQPLVLARGLRNTAELRGALPIWRVARLNPHTYRGAFLARFLTLPNCSNHD